MLACQRIRVGNNKLRRSIGLRRVVCHRQTIDRWLNAYDGLGLIEVYVIDDPSDKKEDCCAHFPIKPAITKQQPDGYL